MNVFNGGIFIFVREVQDENACSPIYFRRSGKWIFFKDSHKQNAFSCISKAVSPSEIFIVSRFLQEWKADFPIIETVEGISIEERPVQLENAYSSIQVTPSAILTEVTE